MSIKTHLYDSAEPAVEKTDLTAICGALVPASAFVIISDIGYTLSLFEELRHLQGICSKCKKHQMQNELKGRYIYGIRSGEEQKQSEASS